MKKKKNAFTLIELLAIIVILAIIAVITVPIILNIIENSRKGAATDSAYGYKDSVNKFYIAELQNHNKLKLDGTYTVKSDGSLEPTTDNTFEFGDSEYGDSLDVQVSGTIPSSGKLRYSNNVLNAGCLVIGDYKITFGTDGKVNETVKGDCESYEIPTTEVVEDTCPGSNCVYAFYTDWFAIKNSDAAIDYGIPIKIDDLIYTTDKYNTLLVNNNQRKFFLGHILNQNQEIEKLFSCGIVNGELMCLQGGIDESLLESKDIFKSNQKIIKKFFPECLIDETYVACNNSSIYVNANPYGDVSIHDGANGCSVNEHGGDATCSE